MYTQLVLIVTVTYMYIAQLVENLPRMLWCVINFSLRMVYLFHREGGGRQNGRLFCYIEGDQHDLPLDLVSTVKKCVVDFGG